MPTYWLILNSDFGQINVEYVELKYLRILPTTKLDLSKLNRYKKIFFNPWSLWIPFKSNKVQNNDWYILNCRTRVDPIHLFENYLIWNFSLKFESFWLSVRPAGGVLQR